MRNAFVVPNYAKLEGHFEIQGDIHIEGDLHGSLDVAGTIRIAAGGICRASARARAAILEGELVGNLQCYDSIEARSGCRVVGDLRAPEIEVDSNCDVDGKIDLLAPAAPIKAPKRHQAQKTGSELRNPSPPPRGTRHSSSNQPGNPPGSPPEKGEDAIQDERKE